MSSTHSISGDSLSLISRNLYANLRTHWQHNTLEEIIGLRVCEATHSCFERSFYRSASAMKSCCTFTDTVGKLLSMAYTLSSSVTSDSELGIYF